MSRLDSLRQNRARSVGLSLIGVMGFLIAGFVFQPIASSIPILAPEDQFEIPFDEEYEVTPQTKQENVGQSQQQVEEIIINALEEEIIQPDIIEPTIEMVTEDLPPETIIQIDDFEQNTTPDPKPDNIIDCEETECIESEQITSDDTAVEQIIDETKDTPADIILPDTGSNTIRLIAEVTKIDSDGVSTVVTTSFDVPLQALFAESQTNRDFENGSLEIRLRAISSNPDFELTGNANLNILIDSNSIFTTQIPVTFAGISGEDGVIAQFTSPTGQKSNVYTFLFSQFIDRFPTQGTTPLEVKLNSLQLTLDSRENFGSTQLDLFSMSIDTDPDLLLVLDEEGIPQRVYPKDVIFKYTNSGDKFVDQGQCRSYWARNAGTITLFDSLNNVIATKFMSHNGCNTFVAIDTILDRNQQYRLQHVDSVNPQTDFDITFTTPKSQKNYYLGCYWSNTIGVGCTYPTPDSSGVLRAPPEGQ